MPGPFIHNIDPVIGQIGGMYLWWYGLCYTLGFLGLFHWLRSLRQFLYMDVRDVYSLSIAVATGVLVGGRLVEVIFYEWAYYSDQPWHIFAIWMGGMSTHGILLGATLGVLWYCRNHQKKLHKSDTDYQYTVFRRKYKHNQMPRSLCSFHQHHRENPAARVSCIPLLRKIAHLPSAPWLPIHDRNNHLGHVWRQRTHPHSNSRRQEIPQMRLGRPAFLNREHRCPAYLPA